MMDTCEAAGVLEILAGATIILIFLVGVMSSQLAEVIRAWRHG